MNVTKYILVTGVFDLLHRGHVYMLENAKKMGDFLIVAIHTDECVLDYKKKIPVFTLQDRIELIKSISYVDMVLVLPYLNPLQFVIKELKDYRPLIMIHGNNWLPDGWDDCAKLLDVEVKQIPLLHGYGITNLVDSVSRYSTTNIINKIKNG